MELNKYDLIILRKGLFAIRNEPLINMTANDFINIDNKLCKLITTIENPNRVE